MLDDKSDKGYHHWHFDSNLRRFPSPPSMFYASGLLHQIIDETDVQRAIVPLAHSRPIGASISIDRWLSDETIDLFLLQVLIHFWQEERNSACYDVHIITAKLIQTLQTFDMEGKLQECLGFGHFRMLYPFQDDKSPLRILFPMFTNGNHWILGFILWTEHGCFYAVLDSRSDTHRTAFSDIQPGEMKTFKLVFTYLQHRFPETFGIVSLRPAPMETCQAFFNPRQPNDEECGIFVCIHALNLAMHGTTKNINPAVGRAFIAAIVVRWHIPLLESLPHSDPHNPEWELIFQNLAIFRNEYEWPYFIMLDKNTSTQLTVDSDDNIESDSTLLKGMCSISILVFLLIFLGTVSKIHRKHPNGIPFHLKPRTPAQIQKAFRSNPVLHSLIQSEKQANCMLELSFFHINHCLMELDLQAIRQDYMKREPIEFGGEVNLQAWCDLYHELALMDPIAAMRFCFEGYNVKQNTYTPLGFESYR